MNIVKKELAELPVIEESKISISSISEALIEAEDGTIFVVDKNGLFKGIITIGDYLRNQLDNIKLEPNNKCKFIYNNQDILENLEVISLTYPNIRIIPILDCENKLLYTYSLPIDYPKIYSELRDTLFKLKIEKPFCLYDYLKEENANKVAIWGVNDLSLEIYDELKRYNNLNEVKLCETMGGGDIEKTSIDIEYLKSIKELIQNTNFDTIIIANLKFKNQFKIFKDLRIKYINDIIYGIKNQDNYLEYCKLIDILYRLKTENVYGVSDYLLENNYKNIAIWGVNELSLLLGDELSKCNDIKNVYVYGDIRKKVKNKIDIFVYNVDVVWVDSIEYISDNTDVIIISDLNNNIYIQNKKLLYINKLLYKVDNLNVSKKIERYCIQLESYGIKTLRISIPNIDKINGLRDFTKKIRNKFINFDTSEIFEMLSTEEKNILFNSIGGNDYVVKFENSFNFRNYRGVKRFGRVFFPDYRSKYINSIDGFRITIGNPTKYNNSIYLIGPCIVDGLFAEDKHTIGSYLQDMFLYNKYIYCVQAIMSSMRHLKLNAFDSITIKKGDIIIFIDLENFIQKPDLNLAESFNKLYVNEEFFFDIPIHCNYKGYKVVAEEIFKYLIKSNFLTTQKSDYKELCLESNTEIEKHQKRVFEGNKDLLNYVDKLKTFRVEENKVIGSIVMNCNPFTLGHRYLIEQSLKDVEWLYIFVVEEDKSMFSFEDRFRLIQESTKDLKNITIIPSGNFIISSKTFSAYFSKDTPTETKIDTSTDIEVFAQHIVPALNIKIRFVGEEPFDIVTNQYNRSMKDILPKYGVEVRVIPRKKIGEEVISASTVRKLLKQKDFDKIKNFVPSATYDFLLKLVSSKTQI